MNTRSPFLALVKMEFLRLTGGSNILAWALVVFFLVGNVTPAFFLWRSPAGGFFFRLEKNTSMEMWFIWPVLLITYCSIGMMGREGGIWSALGVHIDNWNEFLASRAIDRALRFRAKTALMALLIVLPQLLNFGLICLVARQYPPGIGAFPLGRLSNWEEVRSVAVATAFAYTMVWVSAAAIVLTQAYFGLASKLFASRGVLRDVLIGILLPVLGLVVVRFGIDREIGFMASTVQFFTAHWQLLTLTLLALAVPVQRFCERRFAEQEVL